MAPEVKPNKPYIFEETQRLTNWFIWTIVLGILFLFVSILVYQLLTGKPVGNHPAPNAALMVMILVFCLPSILLIRYAKLSTRIDSDEIHYGWNVPTGELNTIRFSEISSCEVITYGFVGYGYRISGKYGMVYNVSGNKGVQLITASGDKILLGTHKATELAEALPRLGLRHNL
jgi:hypothetical protein